MTSLSDLPDDIILLLVLYLEPQQSNVDKPTHLWVTPSEKSQRDTNACLADVKSLASCNRRLYAVLRNVCYRDLRLHRYDHSEEFSILTAFHSNQVIKYVIKSLHFTLAHECDLKVLFWSFPNLRHVTLNWTSFDEAFEWLTVDHIGTSPIEDLRLLNCAIFEAPLRQILNWPKNLKELWIDVDQVDWVWEKDEIEETTWRWAAVVAVLECLIHSLDRLVFSRPTQPHEGLGYGEVIDVSRFHKVKSLSTNHVFLVGWGCDDVNKHLPKSLEELEVYFDDAGYFGFIHSDMSDPDHTWLYSILQNKAQYTPKLKRIRIVSLEDPGEDNQSNQDEQDSEQNNSNDLGALNNGNNTTSTEALGSAWRPPQTLINAFISANVSCSIFLDPKRRFQHVVDGDEGFQIQWEDTWDPEEEYK